MDLKEARRKFHSQRHGAARRGIAWELTFQQWLDWWGDDLDSRGSRAWNLQMQRKGDVGPYALGNIQKGHPKQNARTYSAARQNREVEACRRELQAAIDATPPAPICDLEPDPEDESISSYMSRDPDKPAVWGCRYDRIHRVPK